MTILLIFLAFSFQPIRISVCYWKEKNPGEYDLGKFPTFYQNEAIEGKFSVYGLPSMEYPGYVKVIYLSVYLSQFVTIQGIFSGIYHNYLC